MEGQKDASTLQYEREIRIGMLLLGVLAVVFVGVLARRIWVENGQQLAATKKPIYLTKAQRDELHAKNKPRTLSSLHASSPMRRIRTSAGANEQHEQDDAPLQPTSIPDLVIGESEPAEAHSRPANHFEPEEKTREIQTNQLPTPTREPATPPDLSPSEKDTVPPTKTTSEDDLTSHSDSATESSKSEMGSRFRDDTREEAEESEADSPTPLESPKLVSPPPSTAKPLQSSASKIDDAPAIPSPSNSAEIVRKKVSKNPWKRSDASTPTKGQARYTTRSGDTLRSIAKEILGDEARWREIYDLNRAEIGDDFANLRKGIQLNLPETNDEPPLTANPKSQAAKIDPPSVLKK